MAWYHDHYEEQFGNRARDVVKRGAAPPPPGNKSGSSGGRGAGFAVIVAIVLGMGLVRGLSRPSPRYEPPRFDPVQFNPVNDPQPIVVPEMKGQADPFRQPRPNDPRNELEKWQKRLREQRQRRGPWDQD
jgi:hypothetical protein